MTDSKRLRKRAETLMIDLFGKVLDPKESVPGDTVLIILQAVLSAHDKAIKELTDKVKDN